MTMDVHGFMARFVAGLSLLAVHAAVGAADDYPSRPIRLVVPYQAGGNPDAIARALSGQLERQLGRNIVIDNRAGASGLIGMEVVARANPDGYTMLFATSSLAVNQAVREKPPYDMDRDLAPVSCVGKSAGYLLVVHPSLPARTLAQFVALARNRDKPLTYATSGLANVSHLMGELFNVRAGTHMVNVPYKGSGQALAGVISGEVQMYFVTPTIGVPAIRNGKVRVLGFTGQSRWNRLPEVPAIAETVAGFQMDAGWMGWLAPARTPEAILAKVQREIARALQEPRLREYLLVSGYEPCANTPEVFRRFLRAEIERFTGIARMTNIKAR
ncbi:MAG: tripartite tricarboxylate transporter substrate binding protein [Burkholderiales bacterium]|nr:tripartite tricarboxylate transporter substrate binding protein [Burkholderiales bacterium]